MTSVTGPAAHPTVRSAVDLLSLIPFSLGFRPTESLVVTSVREGGAVGLVARIDLRDVESALLDLLVARVVADGARAAVVVQYGGGTGDHDEESVGDRPGPARSAAAALRSAGIEVVDVLAVSGRGYRSLECRRPGCCPPRGYDLSEVEASAVSAEQVLSGRPVAPHRGAVVADLAPRPAPAVRRAGESASRWLAHRDAVQAAHGTAGLRDWQVASVQRWTVRLRRSVDPAAVPPGPVAAGELLAALTDVAVRDAVLLTVCGQEPASARRSGQPAAAGSTVARGAALPADWPAGRLLAAANDAPRLSRMLSVAPHRPAADAAGRMLAAACAHADDRWVAPAAAALAWISWNLGQGARAALLVERAVRVDPRHGLALLLERSLRAGMPPAWLQPHRLAR